MDRTVVDWMFEHPWMTFFIATSVASACGTAIATLRSRR